MTKQIAMVAKNFDAYPAEILNRQLENLGRFQSKLTKLHRLNLIVTLVQVLFDKMANMS